MYKLLLLTVRRRQLRNSHGMFVESFCFSSALVIVSSGQFLKTNYCHGFIMFDFKKDEPTKSF